MAAEKDTIRFLRLEMNSYSSKLIQQYSLDTNGVATDSIVAWLERSETYSTDMRLARHYFFIRDSAHFDTLWASIPTKHRLTSEQQNDYDELDLIYDLLRSHILSGGSVFEIGQTELDSLGFWSEWCAEPGYLTRSLLRYNGIVVQEDCLGSSVTSREADVDEGFVFEAEISPIIIYPNPADNQITVLLNEKIKSTIIVEIYSPDGRLFLVKEYQMEERDIY
ncbi:MAG: hypothetical protein R2825_29120 [Saprospiraceae bacterium]